MESQSNPKNQPPANNPPITIEDIQEKVATHFDITLTKMHSPLRTRHVARPRQIAMYLARQLTAYSLAEIGRRFGGRDHSTVIHAIRKVEDLCRLDSAFAKDVAILRLMLDG